jgi:hypothetical protein
MMRLVQPSPRPPEFTHQGHRHLSRRHFLQAAAGTTALGAVWGSTLLRPASVAASKPNAAPQPIPGGSPGIAGAFGTLFHVYAPGSPGLDARDAEPATITDFDGVVGLAYVSGMVTRTNTRTHAVDRLPFTDSDMRFMSGVYRDTAGHVQQGTFGFI